MTLGDRENEATNTKERGRALLAAHGPFLLTAGVFLAATAYFLGKAAAAYEGAYIYTVDDIYVHMAIAKNWVEHGVFGVTPYEFSAASSSPLLMVFLYLYFALFGLSDLMPLWLTIAFAVAALFALDALCRQFELGVSARVATGLAVLYFMPMVPVVSTGLEHTMHLLGVAGVFYFTFAWTRRQSLAALLWLCLCGAMAVGSRYEGLFLMFPVTIYVLLTGRIKQGLALGTSSLAPAIIFGLYSMYHGSHFLPNTLLLKGSAPSLREEAFFVNLIRDNAITSLFQAPHLLAAVLLVVLGNLLPNKERRLLLIGSALFVATVLFHMQFASTDWFFRYEAYLMAIAMPLAAAMYLRPEHYRPAAGASRKYAPRAVLIAGCGIALLYPMHQRAAHAHSVILAASRHIHAQQIQMARFIGEAYPPGTAIAANDIGAITYFNDFRLVDVYGLGTLEVANAKIARAYTPEVLQTILRERDVEFIVVFDQYFGHMLSDSAIKVAEWSVIQPYWYQTISFYGPSAEHARVLEQRLRVFEPHLPESVAVQYMN